MRSNKAHKPLTYILIFNNTPRSNLSYYDNES